MSIDILTLSETARWESGQLNNDGDTVRAAIRLNWEDKDNESNGYVNFGPKTVEDGTTRKALFTHPKWGPQGTIKGWHSWKTLPDNAILEVEFGFSQGAVGTDGATFQIWEHHKGTNGRETWHKVMSVRKQYTGQMARQTIDLSHLSGQSVGCELRVDAGGTANQDWACWTEVKVVSRSSNPNAPVRLSRQPGINRDVALAPPSEENARNNHVCTVQKRNVTVSTTEHILLDPLSDFIWPGALVIGSSITTGEYKPVLTNQKRSPIKVSISNIGQNGFSYKEVADPELANVREAINDFHTSGGTSGSRISSKIESIYSEEHLKVTLKGHYKSGLDTFSGSASYDSDTTRNKLIVDFVQLYYTVDVSTLPNRFFEGPIEGPLSEDDTTYVASVTYGRRLLLMLESEDSVQEIKAAIGYASGQSININLDAKYKSVLRRSKINGLVLGGDPIRAAKTLSNIGGFDGTKKAIKDYVEFGARGGIDSPPVPLAYKLRYLSDAAVANVVLSTNYNVRNCQKATGSFGVKLHKVVLMAWDDAWEVGGASRTEEIYGSFTVKAYARPGDLIDTRRIWTVDRDLYAGLYAQTEFKDRYGQASALEVKKETKFTFNEFHKMKDTGYFELIGTIKERDWGNPDDLYGTISKRVYFNKANMPPNYRPNRTDNYEGVTIPDNRSGNHPDDFKIQFQSGNARVEMWFEINILE